MSLSTLLCIIEIKLGLGERLRWWCWPPTTLLLLLQAGCCDSLPLRSSWWCSPFFNLSDCSFLSRWELEGTMLSGSSSATTLLLSFFARNLISSCLCRLLSRPSTSPRLSWTPSSEGRMRSWWRPSWLEESILLTPRIFLRLEAIGPNLKMDKS